jgi:type IV secretion system protein VirB10
VGSNGIFDAFDGEAPDETTDGDVISTIEDDSGEQPQGNPFDTPTVGTAPEDAGPDAEGDGQSPVPETAGKQEMETDRKTGEEPQPFTPSKSPASTVLNDGPHKLNKQLILRIGVGTLAVFIIGATFIAPLFQNKKTPAVKKPDTAAMNPVDYSALVPKKERERPVVVEEPEDDEEILNNLPPVNPEYRYAPPEEKKAEPVAVAGSGNGSSRPDTRGDPLQGKTISGIKGITPTQRQYAQGGVPSGNAVSTQEAANPYARFGMPSKEDYAAQMLSAYGQTGTPGYGSPSSYANQNDQSGKQQFSTAGRENAGNGVWLGPATIWQGTMFEATLTSNINTDLPGEVTAVISKNVYSSLDGKYLLIPQNSKLFGSYNSSISYSQSRVQVAWHTLIRPDGYAISLGNMAATDSQGAAGLKGFVNDHPFQYLKAIALMSVFNVISSEFENTAGSTDNQYVQNVLANSQSVATTLGSKLIDRALDVQPTITIKAGLAINIVANTTLTLPPLEPYGVTQPYHR